MTVNFGDRPAGCIAISALRKTAEQMGKDLPEASLFLMNRTYVDDASWGAATMGRLKELSKELEVIAACGGFEFKETLMSRDPAVDPSEPRKVLGMIWETEADKLQVDVKLTTGGKRSGACIEEDKDLEADMMEVMPDVITKRILWIVAMAQYDPLRLLCGYTVRFKILMRTLTQEETG